MPSADKITFSWIVKSISSKLFSPRSWSEMRRLGAKGSTERVAADAQLRLYSDILPDGFIHLGYFENPDTPPETISLASLAEAQRNHATHVLEQVIDKGSLVLDVGCGTGGLLRLLGTRGFRAVGLTPDRYQRESLLKALPPETEIIHARFEEIPAEPNRHRFGTVITSESFQYLDKKVALDVLDNVLAPGGRWVLCDYLRNRPGHPWSFSWPELTEAIAERGFKVVSQRDITPHILPTLAYSHMLGKRVAVPALDFFVEKVRGKEPRVGHLLSDVFDRVQRKLGADVASSDPSYFAGEKSYRLWVLEKPAAGEATLH